LRSTLIDARLPEKTTGRGRLTHTGAERLFGASVVPLPAA
jgi:hypothetical protein